jgi:uncharacterized protein (DUF934 family)
MTTPATTNPDAPVIVTDTGFAPDDWTAPIVTRDALGGGDVALDLAPDADADTLAETLPRLTMIRVAFPSFADGRGFTIARRLRRMGFKGRLRAAGHVLADQYAMARRSGFDEVEIDAALAARQPEDQWLARADWQAQHYQVLLRG